MQITLTDGGEIRIRSISRADYSAFVEVEKKASKIKPGARGGVAEQQAMLNKEQDRIMEAVYGEDMAMLATNRDFMRVWQATLMYSVGAGEEAVGNSSGSGSGDTTQAD